MNVDIRWYNDAKNVLYIEVGDGWVWEDIDTLNRHTERICAAVPHPIGYLVHAPHTRELPPGLSVTRLKAALHFRPQEKFAIIVGTSLYVQMMISSITGLLGFEQRQRVHFASTLEEAEQILAVQLPLLKAERTTAPQPAQNGWR